MQFTFDRLSIILCNVDCGRWVVGFTQYYSGFYKYIYFVLFFSLMTFLVSRIFFVIIIMLINDSYKNYNCKTHVIRQSDSLV